MRKVILVATTIGVLLCAVAAGAHVLRQHVGTGHAVNPEALPHNSAVEAQGVRRAERAGVRISAAARRIMEQAPLGTCLNDPLQAKCGPRPKAIVAASSRGSAHIAAEIPQCGVHADLPVRFNDYALGGGENQCTAAVSWQELTVTEYQYYKSTGKWTWVAADTNSGSGGQTIHATATAICKYWGDASDARAFYTHSDGYADLNGTWYAASNQSLSRTLYCIT
jgi:hypothetical protein